MTNVKKLYNILSHTNNFLFHRSGITGAARSDSLRKV